MADVGRNAFIVALSVFQPLAEPDEGMNDYAECVPLGQVSGRGETQPTRHVSLLY
jgi:hypothetical protein